MNDSPGFTILAVSPVAEAGGAEVLLVDVLVHLQERGLRVALFVLGDGPLEAAARSRGLDVVSGPRLSFRGPASVARSTRALRRAVGAVAPDVVLSSYPKGQLITWLACLGRRSPAQVTQLYDPPAGAGVSTRVAARLRGTRLAITEETAAAYRQWHTALHPIVIPPGTDRARLADAARGGDGDAVWRAAGLGGGGPRFVMVGRLQRFKGPFDLLDAAALMVPAHPDARFLIIGPESPREPHLRAELVAAITARGLCGHVALAGRLSPPDLAATVRGADLLLHPAHDEPFGLAVVEALALGTPVVAYATTGPRGILESGGGALVERGDVAGLAAVALAAIDDGDTMMRWRQEAQAVAARFDIAASIDRYVEVLGHVHRSQGGPKRSQVDMVGAVPPGSSGVRDYGRLLAAELRRSGISVGETWLESPDAGVGSTVRLSATLLRWAVRVPRPGPVIWHYSPVAYGYRGCPAPGVVLGMILRARGIRVISVLHELAYTYQPGVDRRRARLKAFTQRLALRAVLAGSSSVVVTTDQRRSMVEARVRRRGGSVHVIPVFPTIPVGRSRARPEDGKFVIGVPAYAGDGVRPDVLVDAVVLLSCGGGVKVVLIGAPGRESHDGRQWLRLAAEGGVQDCLEFTGIVSPDEYGRRLAACDVVVLVNEEGPSGRKTSLASALAYGLPVVSLDGYNRWQEVVDAGAIRLAATDAASLAATLARLRDQPSERAALGTRAAVFSSEHMSLTGAAGTFLTLLVG